MSADTACAVRDLSLFEGLSREQLETLTANATVRSFARGETVLAENEPMRGLFILLSGRVKLYKVSPEGREQTIYHFEPGEPFCLMSMFEDRRMPANASALEDSRVLVITGPDFENLARTDPAVLFNMLVVVSRRLKEAMVLIESLSLREIPGRVAAYLLHLLKGGGGPDGTALRLPMTHRELAKVVGATPEALSRAFRKLADDGILSVDGRDINVLDARALADLAG